MLGSRVAYTICMLLATIVAGALLRRQQSGIALTALQKWGVAIGGLVGATFAAKIPFIIGSAPTLGLLGAWLSDGKTILWGLAGGYLGVELAKWAMLIKTKTGDTFVIPLAIAIAIGRVGCLLFGCCYGVETNQSWGIAFVTAPDTGKLLRHPTQIYEIVFHLSFATLAWASIKSSSPAAMVGNWMPLYMVGYATYRFASEFVRPEIVLAGGLTFYQWSSIAIGTGFAGLLAIRSSKRISPRKKNRSASDEDTAVRVCREFRSSRT